MLICAFCITAILIGAALAAVVETIPRPAQDHLERFGGSLMVVGLLTLGFALEAFRHV